MRVVSTFKFVPMRTPLLSVIATSAEIVHCTSQLFVANSDRTLILLPHVFRRSLWLSGEARTYVAFVGLCHLAKL